MKYKLLFLLIVISLFLTINSYATTCSSSGTSVSCSDGVSISMSSCSVSIVGFSCCSNTGSKIDSISWNWLGCSCRSNNYNECGAFERAYSHSCSGTSRSYTYTNCGSDPGCDSSTGQCCVPDCTDKDCGSDGCASVCGSDPADCTANFGTCSASGSQACSGTTYGTCDAVDPRIATCEGLTCGDDGCGGECGSCSGTCNAGTCETCTDGAQNNGETAVDCGGDNCAACGTPTCGTDSATSSCLPNACNTYSSCSTLADTNCVCSGSLNHCTGSCAPAADDTPAECSSYCSAKTAPSGGWTYKSDGCSPADFTDNYRCDGDKRKRYVFVSASDAVCDIDDYPKCTCVYTKNCPSGEECNPNSYSCGVNTCSGPTAFCSTWGAGTWSSTCRSTVDWQLKTPTCSSSTLKHIIYSWAGDDWCSGDNRCYCTKSSACPTGETCSDSENAECVCNNPSGCQTGLTAKCRTGISCDCNDECSSGYCSGGVCTTPPTCTDTASCDDCLYYDAGASCDCDDECSGASTCGTGETCESCSDSILNQDETEVDCGGTICDACPEVCDVFESPAKTCDSTSPCNCGNSCNTAANHKQTSPCDCADGAMTSAMWIEDVTITDLTDSTFSVGDMVQVDVEVMCDSTTNTQVAVAYNNGDGWVNKFYSLCPPGPYRSQVKTLTTTFELTGHPGTHLIRAIESYTQEHRGAETMTCSTNRYADNDDLAITVEASDGTTGTSCSSCTEPGTTIVTTPEDPDTPTNCAAPTIMLKDVDTAGSVGTFTSINAIDEDTIYIGYYDASGKNPKFAKSTNKGQTWPSKVTIFPNSDDHGRWTSIYPLDANTIYAGWLVTSGSDGDPGMSKSTNGGGTWPTSNYRNVEDDSSTSGNLGAGASIAAIDNKVFMSYIDQTNNKLRFAISWNSGEETNWRHLPITSTSGLYPKTFIQTFNSGNEIVIAALQGAWPNYYVAVYKTTTGGGSTAAWGAPWPGANAYSYTSLSAGSSYSFYALDANTFFVAYNYNGLRFSKRKWFSSGGDPEFTTVIETEADSNRMSIYAINENKIVVSYQAGGLLKLAITTDGGVTWSKHVIDNSGNVGDYSDVYAFDLDNIFISYYKSSGADLKFAKVSPNCDLTPPIPYCSSDTDCPGEYCSKHDPDGTERDSSQWVCSPTGQYWDQAAGSIVSAPTDNFCPLCTQTFGTVGYFTDNNCANPTTQTACCTGNFFGSEEQRYVPITIY